MRVDRESFLLLAFSMWGCNSAGGKDTAVAVVEIPPMPSASASAHPIATGPVEESRALPAATIEGGDDDGPGNAVEEGMGSYSSYEACGKAPASASARSRQAGCDDNGTVSTSCATIHHCATGEFPFMRQECESFRRYFKPKVAARATRCMTNLSARNVCDACTGYRCGDEALMSSCPDSSADTPCRTITGSCKSVSMAECRSYLNGMNAQGRQKMVTCLTGAQGCSFGIFSCSESL